MARNRKGHTAMPVEEVAEPEPLCNASAPLVANGNGGAFIGCQQHLGHEGKHQVFISWER